MCNNLTFQSNSRFPEDTELTARACDVVRRWISELIPELADEQDPWTHSSIQRIECWMEEQNSEDRWQEFALFLGEGLRHNGVGYWSVYTLANETSSSSSPDSPQAGQKVLPVIVDNDGNGVTPVSSWVKIARDQSTPINAADLFHEIGLEGSSPGNKSS
ncbi:MAG: hypothetical protein Q4E11_06055 [Corynebacterium sp.]|uniref:hypothetical protein n=1 Tax=Corynebacterium sp. TaxID=1720 RepID=UPI0026DD8979|nr:hypothetical protein [Corynebacterium sp.]MDO5030132.1 hypothetical protein [Corynebacterium sp.]